MNGELEDYWCQNSLEDAPQLHQTVIFRMAKVDPDSQRTWLWNEAMSQMTFVQMYLEKHQVAIPK